MIVFNENRSYFESLPPEIHPKIFGRKLETLAKIALVCKNFYRLAWAEHPFWKRFCRKAELQVTNNNYPKEFMLSLESGNTKALKVFAEIYRENPAQAFYCLDQLLANSRDLPPESIDAINVDRIYLKFVNPKLSKISDDEAVLLGQSISQNENADPKHKAKAEFFCAMLHHHNRTGLLTDDQAVQLALNLSQSEHLNSRQRGWSASLCAEMRIQNRTALLTYDQAIQFSSSAWKNMSMSLGFRTECALRSAEGRLIGLAPELTDDEAVSLAQEILKNVKVRPEHRFRSKWVCIMMGVQERTKLLTYDEAVQILENLLQDEDLTPNQRKDLEELDALLKKHT